MDLFWTLESPRRVTLRLCSAPWTARGAWGRDARAYCTRILPHDCAARTTIEIIYFNMYSVALTYSIVSPCFSEEHCQQLGSTSPA